MFSTLDAVKRLLGEPEYVEDHGLVTDVIFRLGAGNLVLELAYDQTDVFLRLLPREDRPFFRISLFHGAAPEVVEEEGRAWIDFPRAPIDLPADRVPQGAAALRLHVKPALMIELR